MTTQATHTKGPWSVSIEPDKYDSGRDEIRVLAEEDRNHPQGPLTVARVNQYLADESVANARLIAAAPDLLAALRNMLCEVRMSADTENRLARLTIEHAEKAIAKAEGRAGE